VTALIAELLGQQAYLTTPPIVAFDSVNPEGQTHWYPVFYTIVPTYPGKHWHSPLIPATAYEKLGHIDKHTKGLRVDTAGGFKTNGILLVFADK